MRHRRQRYNPLLPGIHLPTLGGDNKKLLLVGGVGAAVVAVYLLSRREPTPPAEPPWFTIDYLHSAMVNFWAGLGDRKVGGVVQGTGYWESLWGIMFHAGSNVPESTGIPKAMLWWPTEYHNVHGTWPSETEWNGQVVATVTAAGYQQKSIEPGTYRASTVAALTTAFSQKFAQLVPGGNVEPLWMILFCAATYLPASMADLLWALGEQFRTQYGRAMTEAEFTALLRETATTHGYTDFEAVVPAGGGE